MTHKLRLYTVPFRISYGDDTANHDIYLASEADAVIGVLGAEVALSGSRIAAYAAREQRLRELADRWDTFIDGIGLVGESDSVDCADELRAILNEGQSKPSA